MNVTYKFEAFFMGVVVILALLTLFISLGYIMVSDIKDDNYCKSVYPSGIEEPSMSSTEYGEQKDVEDGYVRCCRYYWDEHEKKKECKIFEYGK